MYLSNQRCTFRVHCFIVLLFGRPHLWRERDRVNGKRLRNQFCALTRQQSGLRFPVGTHRLISSEAGYLCAGCDFPENKIEDIKLPNEKDARVEEAVVCNFHYKIVGVVRGESG